MSMEYRNLGPSGLRVSALSFGAWITFGDEDQYESNRRCMEIAYEAGVNFFDNAEAYANGEAEVAMGRILRELGWRRDSYAVSSKVFFGIDERKPMQKGTSRKRLTDACEGALKRLGLDYIDLFYCHRHDEATPVEEVTRTMNDLVRQGKILYWGTSEWPAARLMEAYQIADRLGLEGPTMEQPQYNLLNRRRVEREYAPLFETRRLGATIWSPLASGLLTGKYNEGVPEGSRLAVHKWLRDGAMGEDWETRRQRLLALADVADELDLTLPELSIAWCLTNPNVSSAILGASRPEQLEANLKAVSAADRLAPEKIRQRIDEICPA